MSDDAIEYTARAVSPMGQGTVCVTIETACGYEISVVYNERLGTARWQLWRRSVGLRSSPEFRGTRGEALAQAEGYLQRHKALRAFWDERKVG